VEEEGEKADGELLLTVNMMMMMAVLIGRGAINKLVKTGVASLCVKRQI